VIESGCLHYALPFRGSYPTSHELLAFSQHRVGIPPFQTASEKSP
jgi:hypothetical protein